MFDFAFSFVAHFVLLVASVQANLDQDLPNYTQHMVPIFSLPQEWLFCATWCSMDDLPAAKTIDLVTPSLPPSSRVNLCFIFKNFVFVLHL